MPDSSGRPPAADCNRLWGRSGLVCAFPGCDELLVHVSGQTHTTVGEIAHIHGHSPGSARHDPNLPSDDVDSYDNCLIFCRRHHRIIDGDETAYPAVRLREWKHAHEAKHTPHDWALLNHTTAIYAPPHARPYRHRTSVLDDVRRQLLTTSLVALSGISGSGKTQLALELFEADAKSYTFRSWIRSAQPTSFWTDLASLAAPLGITNIKNKGVRKVADLVRVRLHQVPGWLLVIDDAADWEVLQSLPASGGHILITTKNQGWPIPSITVPPFDAYDAEAMLSDAGLKSDRSDPGSLVRLTTGLPLAIAQAVSYIATTGMSVDHYLNIARTHRSQILTRGKGTSHDSAHDSIQQSLQALTSPSAELLKLFGVAPPLPLRLQPIEIATSVRSLIPSDSLSIEDTIGELRSFSLVERDGDDVAVHELVREVVREELSDDDVSPLLST